MISITKEQLDDYRYINSGKYGLVYQVDDHTAYKIYKKDFYGPSGTVVSNPSLTCPFPRLKLLKEKGKKLKYTEVLSDLVSVDHEFAGIKLPYYEGKYLHQFKEFTYDEKKSCALQMVRNSKELTDHYIYCLDYKLNNMIMLPDGTVRFLDLDDIHTKVRLFPDPIMAFFCIEGMGETICAFFHDLDSKPFGSAVRKELEIQNRKIPITYSKMLDYIHKRDEEKSFIEIDEQSDISSLKEFLNHHPYSVIFRSPIRTKEKDYYLGIIQKYREMGISLFDFIFPEEELDFYSLDFPTKDNVLLKEKEFVKVKK